MANNASSCSDGSTRPAGDFGVDSSAGGSFLCTTLETTGADDGAPPSVQRQLYHITDVCGVHVPLTSFYNINLNNNDNNNAIMQVLGRGC